MADRSYDRESISEATYVAPEAGAPMKACREVEAIEGKGLRDDRYVRGTGHWSPYRYCEVTFVAAEDLEAAEVEGGVAVSDGQHRRNLVVRGVEPKALRGKTLRIGTAAFAYHKPRSICHYLDRVAGPGTADALKRCAGFCARVAQGGRIRVGDAVRVE